MEPVYKITDNFWNAQELKNEAEEVKENALVFPYKYSDDLGYWKEGHIKAAPLIKGADYMPQLEEFLNSFIQTYSADFGELVASYMWIGFTYPWHNDLDVMTSKGTHCALNVLLSGGSVPVEYESGSYMYEAAVINTSILHRVIPDGERLMARLSFKEKTYKEVVEGIESAKNRI